MAVADSLLAGRRTFDIVSRYGGEEFVLILPGTPLLGGQIVAERLREVVESLKFPIPMDRLVVTISIGIASFPAASDDNFESFFKRADEALYRAKKNGRNRVEIAEMENLP